MKMTKAIAGLMAMAMAGTCHADIITYTGSLQTYTITQTGTYYLEADGAQGGTHPSGTAGLGAVLGGDYFLTAGTTLDIVVGAEGTSLAASNGTGGGGGTFIYIDGSDTLLLAAGGGGGSGKSTTSAGGNASTGTSGVDGIGTSGDPSGVGGTNGSGGSAGSGVVGGQSGGGGGGGWLGDGGSATAQGGMGFPSFTGGTAAGSSGDGGYGGGGGGDSGGGGGGGYSGGGGGGGRGGSGGGGGSYYDPDLTNLIAEVTGTGDGSATINFVPDSVPEPSPYLLAAVVLAGGAFVRRFVNRRVQTLLPV